MNANPTREVVTAWLNPDAWGDRAAAERAIEAILASGETDEEAWVRIAAGEQTDIAAARARDRDRAEKAIGGEVTAYWTARRALDEHRSRMAYARDQLDDALARAERDGVTAYRLAQASGLTQRAVRMAIDRSRGR